MRQSCIIVKTATVEKQELPILPLKLQHVERPDLTILPLKLQDFSLI